MQALKINPEERNKALALGGAIVVVLGIFSFTVIPRLLPHGPNGELLIGSSAASASTPPSTVAATSPPAAAPASTSAPAAPLAASSPGSMAPPVLTGSVTAVDPFWRPLAISKLPDRMKPNPKPPTPSPTAPHTGSGNTDRRSGAPAGGRLMPLAVGPLKPVPPTPVLPEVELQGIVLDETAMAVLNVGGKPRFLKMGETLEAGWIVYRIATSTVTLKQGRREVTLALGQTLQKDPTPKESAPTELPQENPAVHRLATTLPSFHNMTLQP